MRAIAVLMSLILPACAAAQVAPSDLTRPNTILVSATGKIETAPDVATLAMSVHGDGRTPDAATSALAARQKALVAGLRTLDPRLDVRTGAIAFSEVRGGECAGQTLADMSADTMVTDVASAPSVPSSTPRGPCRVTGYQATIETTIRTGAVKDAGTAVGLAGRLGATSARVEGFALRDEAPAARRALDQAMANARQQATALASASGMRLGPVVSIVSGDASGPRMMKLTSTDVVEPPGLVAPPVVIDIAPTPVETSAQLVVSFALLP